MSAPREFKKPGKNGLQSPKKGTEYEAEFKRHKRPSVKEFIGEWLGVPYRLSYEAKDCLGSTCIGHPFYPIGLYWYEAKGPILLVVPDVEHYAKQITDEHPDAVFDGAADQWRLAKEGAREILREEWDLMVAKHKCANGKEAAHA